MAGLKRRAGQVWPEEQSELELGMYSLHRMFDIVGTHLTQTDVRLLSFLAADVDDHAGGLSRSGRDLFLALERQGRCDETDLRQVLQLLRCISRHDLLPYVTLKKRRAVCPDPVDKYLEETAFRRGAPPARGGAEPRPPHRPAVCRGPARAGGPLQTLSSGPAPGGVPPESSGPAGGGPPTTSSGPAGGGPPTTSSGPAGGGPPTGSGPAPGGPPTGSGPAGGGPPTTSSGPAGGGPPTGSGPAGGGPPTPSSGPAGGGPPTGRGPAPGGPPTTSSGPAGGGGPPTMTSSRPAPEGGPPTTSSGPAAPEPEGKQSCDVRLRVRAEYCQHDTALRGHVVSHKQEPLERQFERFSQATSILRARHLDAITCDVKFSELTYLDAFWRDYVNGSLVEALRGVFLTHALRQAVGEAVQLLVNMDEDDYERGRRQLLRNLARPAAP